MSIEDRIKAYANDKANQDFVLAMLKVGRDKGQGANDIIATIIAHTLMDFHKLPIPPRPTGRN